MSVDTPDRAVCSELERELVRAARRRNAARGAVALGAGPTAGLVTRRRRTPRAAGMLVPVLAAAITIAVVVVAVTSLGRAHRVHRIQPSVPSGPPAAVILVSPRERSNERAALRAASRLRELYDLPAGATPVSGDVSTTAQLGASTGGVVPGVNEYDLHAFWRAPGKPATVSAWIEARPPAGAVNSSTGSGGSGGATLHWNVTFGFPPVPGTISSLELTFTTSAARGGGTAIRIDVESVWVIPRPRPSIIPATVNRIEWSSAAGATNATDHSFSSRANVRELVARLNAVPILRPEVSNACFSSAALYGFRFVLHAGGRAAPVAVATWNGCGGVALDIAGKRYYLWLDTGQHAGDLLTSAFLSGSIP